MTRIRASRIRSVSAFAGGVSSLLTLVAAFVLVAVPAVTPVGPLAAAFLSALVLSLPVWATGLAYALYAAPPDAPTRLDAVLRASALASLGFFLSGLLGTVTRIPSPTVGDALYLVGVVVLLVLAVAVLSLE